ncbi:DUF6507 family protein [Micromonospora sp. WMMA1923]|uniref:DUF6507 family protein n=1 Tax=Micromonospora sp. WMMA1923 TaxID=3404125 RepID=UPI003B9373C1
MSAWDISPDGVRGVLNRTQTAAAPFEGQMKSLNSALEGSAVQSSSEIVGKALQGFVTSIRPDLEFVFTRTGACVNAAAQATNAYVQGDLDMAANAQRSATAAPDPSAVMPGPGRRAVPE